MFNIITHTSIKLLTRLQKKSIYSNSNKSYIRKINYGY